MHFVTHIARAGILYFLAVKKDGNALFSELVDRDVQRNAQTVDPEGLRSAQRAEERPIRNHCRIEALRAAAEDYYPRYRERVDKHGEKSADRDP